MCMTMYVYICRIYAIVILRIRTLSLHNVGQMSKVQRAIKALKCKNARRRIATVGAYTCDDLYLFKSHTCGNGRRIELIQVMVANGSLRCNFNVFKMAARSAVRSENKLQLEKGGFLAKTLTPFCVQQRTHW